MDWDFLFPVRYDQNTVKTSETPELLSLNAKILKQKLAKGSKIGDTENQENPGYRASGILDFSTATIYASNL